jgi:2-oxoisovalerate dehydrogenase E1 component
MKVGKAINLALHSIFDRDENVLLLGEDLLDPYGGAFKISKGLSSKFPDRVFTTPISEAGIVGIATGLALKGFKPFVEIMFGDFLGLTFDQLLNHATKYPQMFEGKSCPLVIRTPMGARRGYGPTHSQTIEKHFLGIPKLNVFAINEFVDILELYESAINQKYPSLLIENKVMYNNENIPVSESFFYEKFQCWVDLVDKGVHRISFDKNMPADITILTYGGMSNITINAAYDLLMEHEILPEIFIISNLTSPLSNKIFESIIKTEALVTVEEGTEVLTIGNYFLAQFCEKNKKGICYVPISAKDAIIPAKKNLEDAMLPSKDLIISKIIEAKGN